MGNNGISINKYVNVEMDSNGMASIVRNHLLVQAIEYGIKLMNNVYVQMATIGVATPVYLFLIVKEDSIGILKL